MLDERPASSVSHFWFYSHHPGENVRLNQYCLTRMQEMCDVRNFHREDAWGQAAEDIPLGHQPGCPVSPLQPPPKRFGSGRYTENVHQALSGDSPQSLLSASKLETQRLSCCKKWGNYLDKPNPSLPLQQSAPTLAAQCVQKWCKYLIKEISLESFYDLLVSWCLACDYNFLKKYLFIYLFILGSLLWQCRLLSCVMQTLSCGMHDGYSSPTRDRTWAPCIGSMESYPLDHQGSPCDYNFK